MASTSDFTVPRRRFLLAAAAAPTFVPGSALGLGRAVAPSERIILGGIGIRNRGGYVLQSFLPQSDMQFVAIADVRADRRAAVKEMADNQNDDSACATSASGPSRPMIRCRLPTSRSIFPTTTRSSAAMPTG